ncbi:hypothetical protein CF_20 [Curtobacterium phage Ayka]|nr:hypothetical protein CF_20 [Curtobacterium phage Ayka]
MAKHITVHVKVTETTEAELNPYGKSTGERKVNELATLTVRADTVEDAHRKVRAVMEGALPLPFEPIDMGKLVP